MSLASDIIRGHTNTIILARLCEGDSYGYAINKDIMRVTKEKFELKEATMYTAFRRLEELGLITSYWGHENIGARRRYYAITEAGRAAYAAYKQEWEEIKGVIDKLIK